MRDRIRRLWKWLRKNVLNRGMIVYVLIAECIFWSPVIVTAILAIIVNKWFWSVTSAILLFWAGPLTPAIPLQIGLALAIKGIVHRVRNSRRMCDGRGQLHNRHDNESDSGVAGKSDPGNTDRGNT